MIKTKKQITEYIKKFCKTYSLDYTAYFCQYEKEDELCFNRKPAPIFGEDSIESKLPQLSELFGLTYDEITSCSEEGLNKWKNKYSFFTYLPEFYMAQIKSDYSETFEEEWLIQAIFKNSNEWRFTPRYDIKNIKERVINKLKELNNVMPGTYHNGASINDFWMETEHLCSFPKIGEMIYSLLGMLNKAKELFFKATKEELSNSEELEYNFLVTVLGIKDVASPHYLYYKNVVLLRDVYMEEGYSNFYSYVKLVAFRNLFPWRAKEFVNDIELVQAYINEYNLCYRDFADFAKRIGKFYCSFIWSDEPFVKDEFSPEGLFADYQQRTNIYIDKSLEEMRGDDEYIEKYTRLAGSPKQGGISLPKRELPLLHYIYDYRKGDFRRASNHILALGGKKNG